MTPKARSVYRCAECGHAHAKWAGKCDGCGAWNTIAEEPQTAGRQDGKAARRQFATTDAVPIPLGEIEASKLVRWQTGMAEFDFVLGGGLVPGKRHWPSWWTAAPRAGAP